MAEIDNSVQDVHRQNLLCLNQIVHSLFFILIVSILTLKAQRVRSVIFRQHMITDPPIDSRMSILEWLFYHICASRDHKTPLQEVIPKVEMTAVEKMMQSKIMTA